MKKIRMYFLALAAIAILGNASEQLVAQDLPEEEKTETEAPAVEAEAPEVFSGIVAYDEIQNYEIDLPPQMEQYRDRMDTSRNSAIIVMFNEQATLSQPAPELVKEEEKVAPNDRRRRQWKMFQEKNKHVTYVDLDNEEVTLQREFFDRTFIVSGAEKPKWKVLDDMSEFLGYTCMRATAMIDSSLVEAWFTPEIPVPAGPDDYFGLPGLILVLTGDEGRHSYVATDVQLRAIDSEIMQAPTEGKKMEKKDYEKMVKERTEEMEKMMRNRWGRRGRR